MRNPFRMQSQFLQGAGRRSDPRLRKFFEVRRNAGPVRDFATERAHPTRLRRRSSIKAAKLSEMGRFPRGQIRFHPRNSQGCQGSQGADRENLRFCDDFLKLAVDTGVAPALYPPSRNGASALTATCPLQLGWLQSRRLSEGICFCQISAEALFDKWELKEKRRRRGSAVA